MKQRVLLRFLLKLITIYRFINICMYNCMREIIKGLKFILNEVLLTHFHLIVKKATNKQDFFIAI